MRSTRVPSVLSSLAVIGSFCFVSSFASEARAQEGASRTTSAAVTTTATTTTTTTAKAPAAPPGTVIVHLDTPSPVTLEHRQGEGAWQSICTSPCDLPVPAGDEFRVSGEGMNDSKPFLLKSGEGERVTLQVAPGRHSKEVLGIWVVGGGAAVALAGTLVILVGSNGKTPFPNGGDTSTTHNGNTTDILVGTGLILGGVVAAVIGGAWVIDNAHTRVGTNQTSASETDKATSPTTPTENPGGDGSTVVSWRQPTFVQPQAAKLSAGLPTYTFSLFSKSF